MEDDVKRRKRERWMDGEKGRENATHFATSEY